jgi:hypothetical protein
VPVFCAGFLYRGAIPQFFSGLHVERGHAAARGAAAVERNHRKAHFDRRQRDVRHAVVDHRRAGIERRHGFGGVRVPDLGAGQRVDGVETLGAVQIQQRVALADLRVQDRAADLAALFVNPTRAPGRAVQRHNAEPGIADEDRVFANQRPRARLHVGKAVRPRELQSAHVGAIDRRVVLQALVVQLDAPAV